MLQFFYGDDIFAVRQNVETVSDFLGIDEFDTSRYDGDSGVDRVLIDLQTPPFFSSHRLVIWFNPNLKRDSETLISAIEYVENAVLIIALTVKPDKRLKVFKALKEAAAVQHEFLLPPPWKSDAIAERIHELAASKGFTLSPESTKALADEYGNDMFRISAELDKLTNAYTSIDGDLVSRSISAENATIFDLATAVLDRNVAEAVELSSRLSAEPPLLVLSVLLREFHTYLSVKLGVPGKPISPQRQRFLTGRLRGVSPGYLQAVVTRLIEAQIAVQEGRFDLQQLTIDLILN